jgi:hypothetical protein
MNDAWSEMLAGFAGNRSLVEQGLHRQCEREGHLYQLRATKAAPTKVACKRCRVEWAIGPRTEPSA